MSIQDVYDSWEMRVMNVIRAQMLLNFLEREMKRIEDEMSSIQKEAARLNPKWAEHQKRRDFISAHWSALVKERRYLSSKRIELLNKLSKATEHLHALYQQEMETEKDL